jgi:hypothetical protein
MAEILAAAMEERPPVPTALKAPVPRWLNAAILFSLSLGAMLILGYHPGLEDDSFYLAAIRKDLNSSLFPHDADFFRLQFQATAYDELVAWSVRLTHIPLEWMLLLWQFASVALILGACARIARHCFEEAQARWAAVGLVAALLTIPVSGTGIALVDQYLHPRAMATAAILWAVALCFEKRFVPAGVLLAAAASLHVIMAAFGVSCCIFVGFPQVRPGRSMQAMALALPLGWVFDPGSAAWKRAAATRTFYFLRSWEWYEWVGVVAPMLLLWLFGLAAQRSRSFPLARFARRLVWFALFQLTVALIVMLPPRFERLRPFEPMRYLQLVYIFLFLLGGGLLGKYVLRNRIWRWAALFVPLCAGMSYAQLQMFPASSHMELPGSRSANQWVRAFAWVKANTPESSYFALDPTYMELEGEDFHGFRGLAERSALADNLKDPGMVARVPRLAARWEAESDAQRGWKDFQAADFRRLKARFGIDWVVLAGPRVTDLDCPYRDGSLRVCRVN